MSSGLRLWSGNGVLEFDTSISTYRVVLSVLVSYAGASKSQKVFSVPGCTPSNSICFLLPINNDTSQTGANRQLECEMGQEVAYVRNYLAPRINDSFSQATMRFIVMRWS